MRHYLRKKYKGYLEFTREHLCIELLESETLIIQLQREVFGRAKFQMDFDEFVQCVESGLI